MIILITIRPGIIIDRISILLKLRDWRLYIIPRTTRITLRAPIKYAINRGQVPGVITIALLGGYHRVLTYRKIATPRKTPPIITSPIPSPFNIFLKI